jgi:hypothetical protein
MFTSFDSQVTCFNDMCGDYFDMLHVKVRSVFLSTTTRYASPSKEQKRDLILLIVDAT